MITKSKHVEAVIRKHWRELIKGGVMWIDAYNCSVTSGKFTGTITTSVNNNIYFFNDPRPRNETDSNQPL